MTDNDQLRAGQKAQTNSARARTLVAPVIVSSDSVQYSEDEIISKYSYTDTKVTIGEDGTVTAFPQNSLFEFKTRRKVSRLGLMMVGLGGNNGTTVAAAMYAKKHSLEWQTRAGTHVSNYKGSLTQCGTFRVGTSSEDGTDVYSPLSSLVPMVNPDDMPVSGWDISGRNLADAMDSAQVLEPDLRNKLRPFVDKVVPLPAAFDIDFIADNQLPRADNLIPGQKQEQLEQLRRDIRNFKETQGLDEVVVIWTANSERYSKEIEGVNDTSENLLKAIQSNHPEVSPSTLYAVASILEGAPYVNGSPQNTLVPGCVKLAEELQVFICGDDFKSGQTKMKSVLVDYLIGCGVKVKTMVTYNHLGNNDMYQLTDQVMWKPKSAAKSKVIEDLVEANEVLYPNDEKPDHVVVVKYVPFLGDSKRDVSEYTAETFLDSHYTMIMHNECLDSALCAPLIIDLAVLCELFQRVGRSFKSASTSPAY
uniref:inositol-3-phosphate synthase n=2 Tax=Rhodosorus marinus TaxID=101924 RepID=A0A7S2ZMU0_9RHOD|mmetsp:Transcript_22695/g.90914  ORF Transcript_22695/g.90914 Transcript_22695/m.90914 type:complete len:477 (+) Transcript_22695:218-1648(+)